MAGYDFALNWDCVEVMEGIRWYFRHHCSFDLGSENCCLSGTLYRGGEWKEELEGGMVLSLETVPVIPASKRNSTS